MIYYLQRIWWFLKASCTPFLTSERYKNRCDELKTFREYRRARWAFAGKGLRNHLTVYLRYSPVYGHVVLGAYVLAHMILGIAIFQLVYSIIKFIGG